MITVERGEALQHLVQNARCLLWSARVEEREGRMVWQREIASEEAAQRLLPLEVGANETYDAAWQRSFHPESRALMERKSSFALRSGSNGYAQDFRCLDAYGHTHWLHEDVSICNVSPDCWNLSGVCVGIGDHKLFEERANLGVALEKVRNAVLKMDAEEDWLQVVEVVHCELRMLVVYDFCGVNMVNRATGTYRAYSLVGSAIEQSPTMQTIPPVFEHAMETGETVYRRDRDEVGAWRVVEEQTDLQSIVDTPFLGGTLVIGSFAAEAFSPVDIEIVEQFAQVLNEGHRRLLDLQRLALQERQLIQVQRLELVDQLTAGLAHELNNPLTQIMGYAQLILRRNPVDEYKQWVEEIFRGSMNATAIVRRLQLFAQEQSAGKQVIDLSDVARRVVELVRHHFAERGVELVDELKGNLPTVFAQPGQIQQLLLHLFNNSLDSITGSNRRGHIWVRSHSTGQHVVLEVRDDGSGIDAEQRAHIFEPFFTTKDFGKGKGLSLSVCYGIAREHGGEIYVAKDNGQEGACFVLELPLATGKDPNVALNYTRNKSEEMGNNGK
jgi:signal transduction histidine kinase